jgi:hypothetical protein
VLRRKIVTAAAAACFAVASCSSHGASPGPTSSPKAQQTNSTTTISSTAAAVPETVSLEKDWREYGGTLYYGCPESFSTGDGALRSIQPKIFETRTGKFVVPAVPAVPAGETITGAGCALSGTVDAMKVIYLVTTIKPARGLEPEVKKITAYVFDLTSTQPLATKEQQPPTADLQFTGPGNWKLAPTASGVAWIYAFTNEKIATSPPRTIVLSNTDLSTIWTDPEAGLVWQNVLSFPYNTEGHMYGAQLRLPSGESIYHDNDIWTVDGVLEDGADKLVKITHWDSYSPAIVSTQFYDLNTRAIIKIGNFDRISGGGLSATLSDGRLFINAMSSGNSQFGGFGVWNLRTQQWELLKNRDEAQKLSIAKIEYFGDHLYITNLANTFSVIALPASDPIASNWSVRPYERLSGWTLVCRGENTNASANQACNENILVKDKDGQYPGPWT